MVNHFIDTQDFTKQELLDLMGLIERLKVADRQGACPPILAGASLAMIFEEPSTRTRVSFEVAMRKLGGHALYLKPGEIHLGVRESLSDTARVLSRMVDAIEVRALKHETVTGLAQDATVPVLNGLTDYNHPTQVLCDVFTMTEHKAPEKALEDLRVVFVGDATNVCNSIAAMTTRMGMHFVHAAPDRYQLSPAVRKLAEGNAAVSGGSIEVTSEVEDAVGEADFVYTDLWWWVGQEDEIPERKTAFMPRYQVSADLLAKAPAACKVMHCLPASRGVEATDEVLDSPQSIIFDQAENRLHTEKGLLTWFIAPRLPRASDELKAHHAGRIEEYLAERISRIASE